MALNITLERDRLRTMYADDARNQTFHGLILGDFGAGKTYLAKTCPGPVLIHSFDPGGTKGLRDEVAAGRIMVDTSFETDDRSNPTAFVSFRKELARLKKADFFSQIGTYIIDSFTTLMDSAVAEIAKKNGRENMILQIQDYQIVNNMVQEFAREICSLPCNTILIGHLSQEKDEVTGRFISSIAATPGVQKKLPLLFDEVYCMTCESSSKGPVRKLLTVSTGKYTCRTRLGSEGRLEAAEEPDIRAILKKVGFPYEDKKETV